MKSKCDQCNSITEVKSYFWNKDNISGAINLCEECKDAIKQEGYRLERE